MSWTDHVDGLDPVTLGELEARAALMVRRDRKYVVPAVDLDQLLDGLPAGARALEVDGRRRFVYTSLYFDTPSLASYQLTARRRRRRFKVRLRRHGPDAPVLMEVKTRGPRGVTVKDRVGTLGLAHPLDPARRLDPARSTDPAHSLAGAVWRDARRPGPALGGPLPPRPGSVVEAWAGALEWAVEVASKHGCPVPAAHDLHPAVEISYRRSTFLLPGDARVTVDTDLGFALPGQEPVELPGWAIMETKTLGAATPVDRTAWTLGNRPERISKFGVGVVLTRPGVPGNRWHRVLSRLTEGN